MSYRAAVLFVLFGLACSGCIFEVWVGAGAARSVAPGDRRDISNAWTAGASSGFYLDPRSTKVRAAFSRHIDETHVGTALQVDKTQARGWSSARLDFELYKKRKRARMFSMIGSWGAPHSKVAVPDDNDGDDTTMPSTATTGRPYKLFVGFTENAFDEPGRFWRDAISWSIGPYVTRWDTGALGTVESAGVEIRITMALSPLGLLLFGGGASKGLESHMTSEKQPTRATQPNKPVPVAPKTCRQVQRCWWDPTAGKTSCMSHEVCD